MKRSRFSAEQTIGISGEAEAGSPIKAVSRVKAGVLERLIRRISSETSETAPTACAKASWTPGVASTSRTAIFSEAVDCPRFWDAPRFYTWFLTQKPVLIPQNNPERS